MVREWGIGIVALGLLALVDSIAAAGATDHPVGAWIQQSPREGLPAPRFTYEGSGGYDPEARLWIHYGGHDGIPQGCHTFTYDLQVGRWRQRLPNTAPPGVCCIDGSNIFDIANRRFVAFPGGSLGHGYQWSRGVFLKSSNVWLYDAAADRWTNMRPPPYKEPEKYSREVAGGLCAGAAYDPIRELAISFGGTGAGGAKNALFVYDSYANRFEALQAENRPSERDGMGLAYDSKHDCLVMFGSQYLDDARTWIYRYATNRWEAHALDPHPPAAKFGTYSTIPRMAYDSLHGVLLCLVWLDEKGYETWALDLDAMRWTKLEPTSHPEPSLSRSRNLAFSEEDNLFILETCTRETGPQIWTYRYAGSGSAPRPARPGGLSAVTRPGGATLAWSGPAGTRYAIERAESAEAWKATFQRIATVEVPRFEDKGIAAGKVYLYRVRAIAPDDAESEPSPLARTQPRVTAAPVVSVPAPDRIEVSWDPLAAEDIAGYNLYRGVAKVRTVTKGTHEPWRDNDPAYPEPVVVKVEDIVGIERLNADLLHETRWSDSRADLSKKGPESGDYKYAVYAYIVRAVNRLGTESGPSPYALTIPSAPAHVLSRESPDGVEIRWAPNPERGIAGYRIYKIGGKVFEIVRVTEDIVRATTFVHRPGGRNATRYFVVAIDALGQEGEPSSPVWAYHDIYRGFYEGECHP